MNDTAEQRIDPQLLEVLKRIAGALEELAAFDRGERQGPAPVDKRTKQQQYEQDSTGQGLRWHWPGEDVTV